MNSKILMTVVLFSASVFIGRNITDTNTVQATPMKPYYLELPKLAKMNPTEKKTEKLDTIEIVYNKETQEVSVKGKSDALVNVTTIGEVKPTIKWKTRTKIVEKKVGYPYTRKAGQLSEDVKPAYPFSKIDE